MANLANLIGKKVMGYSEIHEYDGPGTVVAFSVTTPHCVVVEWSCPGQGLGNYFGGAVSIENMDDLVFI